jgi:hypothetical protein
MSKNDRKEFIKGGQTPRLLEDTKLSLLDPRERLILWARKRNKV